MGIIYRYLALRGWFGWRRQLYTQMEVLEELFGEVVKSQQPAVPQQPYLPPAVAAEQSSTDIDVLVKALVTRIERAGR